MIAAREGLPIIGMEQDIMEAVGQSASAQTTKGTCSQCVRRQCVMAAVLIMRMCAGDHCAGGAAHHKHEAGHHGGSQPVSLIPYGTHHQCVINCVS